LKIEVQLSNTKLLQIDANNAVRVAQVNLNNLLGLPLPTQTEITTEIRHDPRTFGGWSSLVDTAVGQRADLQAMELRVKAGEASVSAARGAWWPQISVFGDYLSARPNPRVIPAQDIYKDTWDFGIQVSLDVWNWGIAAHQTAQAEAQLAQAKDAQGSLRDAVALEVTQNYLALQQAKEKIGVARQTIDQAEENSRITSDKFKEGLALTTDVLDADVALLQAKTNYTQSLVDYELAEGRLEKSLGEEAR
ncbi:MAG TPA: TolC family protein, partial [Bacteroidota bacterium]|nr:TolC family protein [Bacteroidota bacterium]